MKRYLLILWLRLAAPLLDLIHVPHNFRRRLGQLTRRRGAASLTTNDVPHELSGVTSVANPTDQGDNP